jgi:hypothetical protein
MQQNQFAVTSVSLALPIGGRTYFIEVVPNDGNTVQLVFQARQWDMSPVDPGSPREGYTLSSGGAYITRNSIYVPQRNVCLTASTNVADAAHVMPIQLDDGHYCLQLVGQPGNVLTFDTRGYLTQFESLQGADGYPYFQRFPFTGQMPGLPRKFFWLAHEATSTVMTPRRTTPGDAIVLATVSENQAQFFEAAPLAGGDTMQLLTCLDGLALDVGAASDGVTPLTLTSAAATPTRSQLWSFDSDRVLVNAALSAVATAPAVQGDPVIAAARLSGADARQKWRPVPVDSGPTPGDNQFENLQPGCIFSLLSITDGRAITAVPGDVTARTAVTPPAGQAWTYKNGLLINVDTGQALTAQPDGGIAVMAVSGDPTPFQKWAYDGNGYLLLQADASRVLVTTQPTGASPLALQGFDPSGAAPQYWFTRSLPSSTAEARPLSVSHAGLGSDIGDSPSLGALVATLKVRITIANDWFSGTTDDIYVSLAADQSVWTRIMSRPSRGDQAEISIDLLDMFPCGNVTFADLSTLYLGFDANGTGLFTDDVKIAGIVLTATDQAGNTYQNNSFSQLNQWIRPQYRSLFHWSRPVSWVGNISWAGWTTPSGKPMDLFLKTYGITLMPYIGDMLSWRTYDPSTIDGVGLLIGSMNGLIVGDNLKNRRCEILGPGAYTWVYVPSADAIIYKYWNKNAPLSDYTRHSQLASGAPVICAGEVQLVTEFASSGMEACIAMMNDASGHYKPDGGSCLSHVSDKFERLGISTRNTQWYWKG